MTMIAELPPEKKVETIKGLVGRFVNGSNWLYLIINHIDPDSLGAAFGMKHFFKRIGVDRVKILFCGDPGNEQNRYMINDMGLMEKMSPLEDACAAFTDKDIFALLDSCSAADKRLGCVAGKFRPLIVIDHHRDGDYEPETDDNFIWVEDRMSCAGMVVELIEELGFDFTGKGDDDLAILLALGILIDNGTFISDMHDAMAFAKIIKFCNRDQLQLFVDYPLSNDFIKAEKAALNNCVERGSIVVTSLGSIAGSNKTFIAQIADHMIRRLGYTLVIVWAWLDDCEVYICARSADSTSPLSEYLRSRFGDRAGSKLGSGGRISKGAAQMTLNVGDFLSAESRSFFLQGIAAFIEGKVFEK